MLMHLYRLVLTSPILQIAMLLTLTSFSIDYESSVVYVASHCLKNIFYVFLLCVIQIHLLLKFIQGTL